jgi:mannose-6-phosphate isomerase-like protein (cupin superfamily)
MLQRTQTGWQQPEDGLQKRKLHMSVVEAMALLPGPDPEDRRYAVLFERGSMRALVYAPQGHDPQTPHDQDELYMVTNGHGAFELEGERRRVVQGDIIFVPARGRHRFVDFTEDLSMWAIFFGDRED